MVFDRIYIEISNVCNLQCSFCPEVLRPKKIMSPSQFRVLAEKVKPHARAVTLHLMGEPLAHPQFPEFIQILQDLSIPLILTSNGTLINRHHNLLARPSQESHSIIKQINFSVHSFFDNFPGKNIEGYLNSLVSFSKSFITHNPESFINFRLWNLQGTHSDLTPSNQLIYEVFQKLFPDPDLPSRLDVQSKKSYRLDRHIKMHFDTQFEWPNLKSEKNSTEGFCYGLKSQLAILTEGTVVPCCLDKEAVINLGSIFENSLESILNSPRAQKIVQGFQRNQVVEPLCQKCSYKQRFQ